MCEKFSQVFKFQVFIFCTLLGVQKYFNAENFQNIQCLHLCGKTFLIRAIGEICTKANEKVIRPLVPQDWLKWAKVPVKRNWHTWTKFSRPQFVSDSNLNHGCIYEGCSGVWVCISSALVHALALPMHSTSASQQSWAVYNLRPSEGKSWITLTGHPRKQHWPDW